MIYTKSISTFFLLLYSFATIAQQDTLITVIKNNKFDLAEQMILEGENIHAVDSNGANPLLWACRKGNLKLVKLLVEREADLYPDGGIYSESKYFFWGSPTAVAVAANNLEILKYLLEEQNFPINYQAYSLRTRKRTGSTILRWALRIHNSGIREDDRTDIIKYLLDKGADKATARSNLAIYQRDQGHFTEAISLFEQEIETPYKKGDFWKMYMHYELAATYRIMGGYNQAISWYLKIVEHYEQLEDFHAQVYLAAINRLGVIYQEVGDYEKAEYYLIKSNQLYKERVGEKHRDYLINANSLAILYQKQGKYKQALDVLIKLKPNLQKAIELTDIKLQTDSIHYYRCLYDIASNPEYQKHHDDVLERLSETIKFFELRNSEVDYATNLRSIGYYYATKKNYKEARLYYENALAITDTLYASSQKFNRIWQLEMAQVEEQLGDITNSSKRLATANEQTNTYIRNLFSSFSEREQQFMSQKEIIFFDQLKSYHYRHQQFNAEIFNNELFLKGLLLRNNQALVRQLSNSNEETILASYEKWLYLKKLIASQLTLPVDKTLPNLEALQQEAEALEGKLARKSALFSKQQTLPTWTAIQDQLKEGEAAIQITNFRYYEPFRRTDSIFYIAQIIQPDVSTPISVFLCEEKQIKKQLGYKVTTSKTEEFYASRGIVPKNKSQKGLQMIWKQLLPYLSNTHTLYMSNSGIFNELNIGAIPIEKDQLAIDRFQIHQYLNLNKILKNEHLINYNNNYLLVGGVDYNSIATSQKHLSNTNKGWDYLQGTQEEVRAIHKIVKKKDAEVLLLEQQFATEDSLKVILTKSPSPKCIHIATHGFFFPKVIQDSSIYESRLPYAIAEDPMIRSGLVLANANYSWLGQSIMPNHEDGILTAKEVINLQLGQTELVVLSACQTGLGDVQGNEGVYGLQRAFKQAGVRYLILSLWEVPDSETAQFMETFYYHYLEEQLPIRTAFNATQQAMRIHYENPYQWAAFVLVE